MQKQCFNCKQIKNIEFFHKNNHKKDGLDPSCKQCRLDRAKKFYEKNKEHIKKRTKTYYEQNKEILYIKQRERNKKKLQIDPYYKLTRRLRNRLYYALLNKNWKKNTHFSEYIGCDRETLIKHIEAQFTEGMNWENYGKWHVDHIIPLVSSPTPEEIYKLCHYKNLRPLWAKDNISKGSKIYAFKFNYNVKSIDFNLAKLFIEKNHYSKKLPPSKYYFGLFNKEELVGVCSYSLPRSPNYRTMLIDDNNELILELNRLALKYNIKNEASILISRTIKLLPKNTIILSYSDTKQNHSGYIYQASNFRYYGLTEKRLEYYIEGLHSKTVADNELLKKQSILKPRSLKHRYIYCKNHKMYSNIKYKEQKYPK